MLRTHVESERPLPREPSSDCPPGMRRPGASEPEPRLSTDTLSLGSRCARCRRKGPMSATRGMQAPRTVRPGVAFVGLSASSLARQSSSGAREVQQIPHPSPEQGAVVSLGGRPGCPSLPRATDELPLGRRVGLRVPQLPIPARLFPMPTSTARALLAATTTTSQLLRRRLTCRRVGCGRLSTALGEACELLGRSCPRLRAAGLPVVDRDRRHTGLLGKRLLCEPEGLTQCVNGLAGPFSRRTSRRSMGSPTGRAASSCSRRR